MTRERVIIDTNGVTRFSNASHAVLIQEEITNGPPMAAAVLAGNTTLSPHEQPPARLRWIPQVARQQAWVPSDQTTSRSEARSVTRLPRSERACLPLQAGLLGQRTNVGRVMLHGCQSRVCSS